MNVAQALGDSDHVSPIVKAVRTSPVGAALASKLSGILGEGGAAEEVMPVKLNVKKEPDETNKVDVKPTEMQIKPAAQKMIVIDDDEPEDTVEKEHEKQEYLPVKLELNQDKVSTNYETPKVATVAPVDQLPVVKAVEYLSG